MGTRDTTEQITISDEEQPGNGGSPASRDHGDNQPQYNPEDPIQQRPQGQDPPENQIRHPENDVSRELPANPQPELADQPAQEISQRDDAEEEKKDLERFCLHLKLHLQPKVAEWDNIMVKTVVKGAPYFKNIRTALRDKWLTDAMVTHLHAEANLFIEAKIEKARRNPRKPQPTKNRQSGGGTKARGGNSNLMIRQSSPVRPEASNQQQQPALQNDQPGSYMPQQLM